jgi:hypothetical protein
VIGSAVEVSSTTTRLLHSSVVTIPLRGISTAPRPGQWSEVAGDHGCAARDSVRHACPPPKPSLASESRSRLVGKQWDDRTVSVHVFERFNVCGRLDDAIPSHRIPAVGDVPRRPERDAPFVGRRRRPLGRSPPSRKYRIRRGAGDGKTYTQQAAPCRYLGQAARSLSQTGSRKRCFAAGSSALHPRCAPTRTGT